MIKILLFMTIITFALSVTFQSLFNKELKSSYGFQIFKYYHQQDFGNNTLKKFKGESLLYLTPWRERGKEIALKFINKFDYLIPCYYDLIKKMDPERIEVIKNIMQMDISTHYSQQYLKKAKQLNPKLKILPRLYVHGVQGDVFYLAGLDQSHMTRLLDHIRQILNNPLYDGILLCSTFLTPNTKFPWSMKQITKNIRQVVDAYQKLLFISFEGVDDKPDRLINKKKARQLMSYADKIIIHNFDYPKGSSGGIVPVCPLKWVKQNVDFYSQVYSREKLMPKLIMVLPLYGYYVALFGKYDPLEGTDFIDKLKKQKQAWMEWSEQFDECVVTLNKMEFLFYPCLHFFEKRLRYFQEIGAGVGGFEAGSSLQIMFQMF